MSADVNQVILGKVKTREELKELIGPRPRKKSVIICHGSFDIVHPGHLRHLIYAKSKADILIASITSDAHISKANFRPFVPEQLRALNLAALQVVDYVLIDRNPTPLENLAVIQPDYFAKGFEYFQGGVHPKTKEELEVLRQYGGELIFTPGDVVYSSSALMEASFPDISADKLDILMREEGLTFSDLRKALESFQGTEVHVLGDTIVDSYTYCSLIGAGTKTPTPSVKFQRQKDYAGGAAVVAKHLKKAGANVVLSTVLGEDTLKDFVLEDLKANGVEVDPVIDRTRPTVNKNVFIADTYRLLKVDKVDNRVISDRAVEYFENSLAKSKASVFLFCDFRHGIFSRTTIPTLVEAIPKNALKVADSQVASRWGNILEFKDFDLITPNEREARFALGDQDSVIRPLAFELYQRSGAKYQILKMGSRGVLTYRAGTDSDPRAFFAVDTFAKRVVDAVGTGDALLSYATLALATTGNIVIASILGSMAAAVACELEGNNPVAPSEVLRVLDSIEKKISFK